MAGDDVTEGAPPTVFPGFAAMAAADVVDRLVQRRLELGLSQTVVAARMGTSQSAVARLEAGRSDLRLSTLQRYAAALGTSVGYAVGPPAEGGRT